MAAVPPGLPPLPDGFPRPTGGPSTKGSSSGWEAPTFAPSHQREEEELRLRERLESLGFEAPTAIRDTIELSALVHEVEVEQHRESQVPAPEAPVRPAAPRISHVRSWSREELGFVGEGPSGGETEWRESQWKEVSGLGYWDEAFADCVLPPEPAKPDHEEEGGPQQSTSEVLGVASAPLDGTMSAPGAVRGSCFSWVRGEALGRGSLGKVFRALDQNTGQVIAVKELCLYMEEEADAKFKAALENEIAVLKDLKHPHVVSYLGHDFIDNCLYMYLEYMPGGSVAQVLRQFGPFEECLIAEYSRQVVEGVVYLHTREPPVVHRDIKGGNILAGVDGRVKVADFGCSKRTQETMSHTMRGSVHWMAPEVIAHTRYGRAADVWSFGCVLIEMATGSVPWGKFDNQFAAMVKIGMSKATPPLPKDLSPPCEDLIRQCVQRDAASRPRSTELASFEFFRGVALPE